MTMKDVTFLKEIGTRTAEMVVRDAREQGIKALPGINGSGKLVEVPIENSDRADAVEPSLNSEFMPLVEEGAN